MYVYIAKFNKHPDLIKIGISVDVPTRMSQLCKSYGKVLNVEKFKIGDESHKIEKFLHGRFSKHRVEFVIGEGCTEFFKDCVYSEATTMLKALAQPVTTLEEKVESLLDEEAYLNSRLNIEKVRHLNYIRRVLDRSATRVDSTDGSYNTGFKMEAVFGAIKIGFSAQSVFKKVAKHFKSTPKRVELAYRLYDDYSLTGSTKARELRNEYLEASNQRHAHQVALTQEQAGQPLTKQWVLEDTEARHSGRRYTKALLALCEE
jgi:hypothetical protein